MQVFTLQSPALQVPSAAQVSPAAQSAGWPQYTGLEPPAPVPVLLELLPPVPAPPVPELELALPWQLAVWVSGLMTQVKPATQPALVQSPLWHCPSVPQVSFCWQSEGWVHPGGKPQPGPSQICVLL